MSKRLSRSSRNLIANTVKMVNFTNRKKEENLMWNKYSQIKKRKLEEQDSSDSDDSNHPRKSDKRESLYFHNKGFREDSFRVDNNEIDKDELEQKNPTKDSKHNDLSKSDHEPESLTHLNDQHDISMDCAMDSSFSFGDNRRLIIETPGKKQKKGEFKNAKDKIKKREKHLKKQLEKNNKEAKKKHKKLHKSKK